MKRVHIAIAVLVTAIILIACRASALTSVVESQAEATNTTTSAGDAPTSSVSPGYSPRTVRPPGPGAVRPELQALSEAPADAWDVLFFSSNEPKGDPLAIGKTQELYLESHWLDALPDPELGAQVGSVVWARNVDLKGGALRFYAWSDGGLRLWVNGRPIIDWWDMAERGLVKGDIWLDRSGPAEVILAFHPLQGSGQIRLWWEQVIWFPAWRGEYYANRYLTGQPLIVRNDPMPVFDWGLGAPALGLPADDFSVRWSRTLSLSAGCYRFAAEASDGVRVYLNESLIINAWHEAPEGPLVRELSLAAGDHDVVIEYFDAGGPARVSVTWERILTDLDSAEAAQSCGAPPEGVSDSGPIREAPNWGESVSTAFRRLYRRLVGPPIWW